MRQNQHTPTPKNIFQRWLGIPVWTQDHDGEVRKSRLKVMDDGTLIVKGIGAWKAVNNDGTASTSYIVRWWLR